MGSATFDRELVRKTMREQKMSQAKMAEALGLASQSSLSELLSGKRQVKVQEADTIYRMLGLDRIGGETIQLVPIIGLAAAGNWREAIEMPIGRLPVPKVIAGSRAFGVEVAGDSINLLVDDGGWIVVDPDDKVLVPGKFYLLQNSEFETTVKRYQKSPARFEPASDNPTHMPFEVGEQDFVVLGRVVWKGEKL